MTCVFSTRTCSPIERIACVRLQWNWSPYLTTTLCISILFWLILQNWLRISIHKSTYGDFIFAMKFPVQREANERCVCVCASVLVRWSDSTCTLVLKEHHLEESCIGRCLCRRFQVEVLILCQIHKSGRYQEIIYLLVMLSPLDVCLFSQRSFVYARRFLFLFHSFALSLSSTLSIDQVHRPVSPARWAYCKISM